MMSTNWSRVTRNTTKTTLLLSLCCFFSTVTAQPVDAPAPSAVAQKPAELKIYKQRFRVTANVVCQVHPKRPTFCKAYVEVPIRDAIHPEIIISYSDVAVNEKTYDPETLPEGNFQFRTDRLNLSGMKELEVDVIYIK